MNWPMPPWIKVPGGLLFARQRQRQSSGSSENLTASYAAEKSNYSMGSCRTAPRSKSELSRANNRGTYCLITYQIAHATDSGNCDLYLVAHNKWPNSARRP